jgi:exosortase N
MTTALSITDLSGNRALFASLVIVLVLGGVFCFPSSYLLHMNVIAGALLFPFTIFITGERRNNFLLIGAVVLFSAFALSMGVRIGYFVALWLSVIWLIEYFIGRCNALVLFQLLFMSPVFTQITTVLGFTLRLKISGIAASLLRLVDLNAFAEGNLIVLDGVSFSVDEACVGLSMLSIAMIAGAFILGHRYRTSGKTLSAGIVIAFFASVFAVNVVTNLGRILLLVCFHIAPETVMHEAIGLICLIFYTIIPIYFGSGWMMKMARTSVVPASDVTPTTITWQVLPIGMTLLMLLTGVAVAEQRRHIDQRALPGSIAAPTTVMLNDGIAKVTTEHLLIYVKPIAEWFTSEHTPLICWKGSCYSFVGVREVQLYGRTLYCGRLVKGNEQLSTAWWYSNGRKQTISQLEWRKDMLMEGAEYNLINVTAADEQTLLEELETMFRNGGDKMLTTTSANL